MSKEEKEQSVEIAKLSKKYSFIDDFIEAISVNMTAMRINEEVYRKELFETFQSKLKKKMAEFTDFKGRFNEIESLRTTESKGIEADKEMKQKDENEILTEKMDLDLIIMSKGYEQLEREAEYFKGKLKELGKKTNIKGLDQRKDFQNAFEAYHKKAREVAIDVELWGLASSEKEHQDLMRHSWFEKEVMEAGEADNSKAKKVLLKSIEKASKILSGKTKKPENSVALLKIEIDGNTFDNNDLTTIALRQFDNLSRSHQKQLQYLIRNVSESISLFTEKEQAVAISLVEQLNGLKEKVETLRHDHEQELKELVKKPTPVKKPLPPLPTAASASSSQSSSSSSSASLSSTSTTSTSTPAKKPLPPLPTGVNPSSSTSSSSSSTSSLSSGNTGAGKDGQNQK